MLITKADIRSVRDISETIEDRYINPYIEEAENIDLKNYVGNALAVDIIENPNNHVNLLNRKLYTYNGVQYKHEGLKKVLSLLAYSRYILNSKVVLTPFGAVEKNYDGSERVRREKEKDLSIDAKNCANLYFHDIKMYIIRHITSYELFEDMERKVKLKILR